MIEDLELLRRLGEELDRPLTFQRKRRAVSAPLSEIGEELLQDAVSHQASDIGEGEAEGCPQVNQAPETVREALIWGLLKIRNKKRDEVYLNLNRAQREYARNCTKRNIVLKARQLGMTT